MRKSIALALSLFLLTVSSAVAGPDVKCEVTKVSEHKLLVTFRWTVKVVSDRPWDACDIRISFRDSKDLEIYRVEDVLKLATGANTFTGTEICEKGIWSRISGYRATLDCVF